MELLQLKYFCDAARTQNFSKTAQKYLVPTSNISQSVKRLENELGAPLFDHRSNKIILNEQGKRFFERVSGALELIDTARDELFDNSGTLSGDINILCRCNRRIVTDAIERFKEKYPEVSFILKYGSHTSGDFDVLISDTCPYECEKRLLVARDEILLAMHSTHPLAALPSVSVGDLQGERFITMTEGESLYKITVSLCSEAGFTPNIAIQTDDPFYIRKYIELGLGIAFVPSSSWQGLFSPDTALKSIGDVKRSTYAYLPKNKHIKRSVEEFLNILSSCI